jgi:hypothetical protein
MIRQCKSCEIKESEIRKLKEVNAAQLRRLNETYLLKQQIHELRQEVERLQQLLKRFGIKHDLPSPRHR